MRDKPLYRWAYEQYGRWNEARERKRARSAGCLSPEEAWRRYVELVEFCRKLCPQQGEAQRREKPATLERYYESVHRMEAWRQSREKKAVALLESHGYRYALVGGVALSQWGVICATHDVDIKVLVPDMDYSDGDLTLFIRQIRPWRKDQ